jgi:type I restriction enzyme S subunit
VSWRLIPLSEVAPAKPLKKVQVSDDESVVQITLDHIESNTGRLLNKIYLPVAKAGSSTHWFDENHVLYSKLRPCLNKVYLPDEIGLGTTELVPLLPDQDRLDRKYLAYYLRSKPFVDWVSSQTAGAKMPRVSMKVFWDHCIPLPPLEEQKRIATILDKADAIRRKRQQAIQLADEFLRAVFLDMFGDIPARRSQFELKGCRGAVSAASGKSSKSVLSDTATEFPVYGGNGINGYATKALYEEPVIVVGRVGQQCGITHVTSGPSWVTDNAIVVRVVDRDKFNLVYLAHAFKVSPIRDVVTRLDLPFVNQAMILDYPIPHPPIELQKKYADINKKLCMTLEGLAKAEDYSYKTYLSLSRRAFSDCL